MVSYGNKCVKTNKLDIVILYMTLVALWRLSYYDVCHIMTFVASWRLSSIMTFVAYRVCRSICNSDAGFSLSSCTGTGADNQSTGRLSYTIILIQVSVWAAGLALGQITIALADSLILKYWYRFQFEQLHWHWGSNQSLGSEHRQDSLLLTDKLTWE